MTKVDLTGKELFELAGLVEEARQKGYGYLSWRNPYDETRVVIGKDSIVWANKDLLSEDGNPYISILVRRCPT